MPGKYSTVPARNGSQTLVFREEETGREIKLHSRYDPQKEADRTVESFSPGRASVILVSGLGLAYHINSIRKKYPSSQVLVLEADKSVTGMCREINPEFIEGVYIINSSAEMESFFESFDIASFKGISHFIHRPSFQIDASFYESMAADIKQYISSKISDLLTRFEFEEKWIKNIFSNISHLRNSPGAGRMAGKFTGMPGIIVSAGPSLKNNIDQLRELRDRAVIVAVDTALKVLDKHGISPHFVLTLDAQKFSQKHFTGVNCPETVLVADIVSCPSILNTYSGRKMLSTTSKYYQDSSGNTVRETTPVVDWIEKFIPPFGDVQSGGSVATSAFDLLLNMGCDPIILIGQDLAYTGREIHCSGTYHNDGWLPEISRLKNLECINQGVIRKRKIKYVNTYGGKGRVISDFVFDLYKSWFEDSAGKVAVSVINSTEGGAEIKNTSELPLYDAVSKAKRNARPSDIIDSIMAGAGSSDISGLRRGIEEAYEAILEILKIWDSDSDTETRGKEINSILDSCGLHQLFSPMLRKSRVYISRHGADGADNAEAFNRDIINSAEKLRQFIETSGMVRHLRDERD